MRLALLHVIALAAPALGTAVVRAGDAAIEAQELSARAAALRAAAPRLTGEQLLDAVIGDLVLAQEARRTKIDARPAVRASVDTERARALAAHFAEAVLPSGVKIPEEEILRLYHLGNDTARLSLVVLATEEEAAQARKRLEQGGEWALEASRSLDSSSASRRGDTGVMSRMQLDDALAAAVFSARPGALLGPVRLALGWAVARVDERSIAADAALPGLRPQIESYARRTAAAKARAHLLEQKRKAAAVTIDDAFLGSLRLPLAAGAAELDRTVATVGTRQLKLRDVLPAIRSAPALNHGSSLVVGRAVRLFVDDLLLADEAFASGLDRTPAGSAVLQRAEVRALARAMGEDLLARLPKGATEPDRAKALTDHVARLRKEHAVWVDRKKALAAVSQRN